jgi:hypothetical protein
MNPRTGDEDIHEEGLAITCAVLDIGGDVVVGGGTVFVPGGEGKQKREAKDRIARPAPLIVRTTSRTQGCGSRAG